MKSVVATFCQGVITSAVFAFLAMSSVHAQTQWPSESFLIPKVIPAPAENQPTTARVTLGRVLFFDPRLSGSNAISCATCHNPGLGWSDALPTGIGHGATKLTRNTPTVTNSALSTSLMWDGRKKSLEDQALGPIEADQEMSQDIPGLVKKLTAFETYRSLFDSAYPGEGISGPTIAKALANFQRTLVSTDSPFDRWIRGDANAVGADVKRGFEVFRGNGNCAVCHQGANFSDNGFHNIGVKNIGSKPDDGRFGIRKLPSMKGAFKTPTLRDVTLTAPYMHNGMYSTLEEVVEHYDRGGDTKDALSPNIKPLNLTAQDKSDLVAFMKALTGKPITVAVPQLPIH